MHTLRPFAAAILLCGAIVVAVTARQQPPVEQPSARGPTSPAPVATDLAVGYAEAGRLMAGEPPTMWVARHMQGPLGGFALAAPAAYAMCMLFI